MKFFRRLNTLMNAFLMSLGDIMWVGILVLLMLYIFGILCTNFFGNNDYLKVSNPAASSAPPS